MQQSLWAGSRNDLVNPTPLQGKDLGKKMKDISGRKCLESFKRFAQNGLWAKTFSDLLIGTGDWFSTKCNLTWKLRGTKFNRMYFQLVPSTLPTEETGCGLWPTPTSVQRDHPERVQGLLEKGAETMMSRKNGENRPNSILDMAMFTGLIPTPDCSDRRSDNSKQWGLSNYARNGLLPTPTADDCPAKNTGKRNQDGLQKRAFQATGKTSQLNHRFVMEMMGFPPNWCDIYYEMAEIAIQKKRQRKKLKESSQKLETKQSKPEETP